MRVFVLVSCLWASVLARPEAGYNYKGLQQNLLQQQLPSDNVFANFAAPAPSNAYIAPSAPELTINSIEHSDTSANINNQLLEQQDSYNAAYHESSIPQEAGYAYSQPATTIHKHVYVHVPPKEFEQEDVIETRIRHAPAAKQKHYKIVFIKAPSPPVIRAPVLPPPPQHEEKTLIYVLHQKPEGVRDIVIPALAPAKPSKPEVYFIKYKTRKAEAPVYGPPPQKTVADLDPRHGDVPASPSIADEYTSDLTAPHTTNQPSLEQEQEQEQVVQQQEHRQEYQQQQQQQFINEPSSVDFELPSSSLPFATNEHESHSDAQAPSKQYLVPEAMSAIVVDETPSNLQSNLPSANYGPPTGFFQQKK